MSNGDWNELIRLLNDLLIGYDLSHVPGVLDKIYSPESLSTLVYDLKYNYHYFDKKAGT